LTPNELEHARRHFPHVALFVLSGVVLRDEDGIAPQASSGVERVLEPWAVEDDRLTPVGFAYAVPDAEGAWASSPSLASPSDESGSPPT
jgi:hypothetical protein